MRNPRYLGVITVIAGQALLLSRPVLLIYAAAFLAWCIAFVRLYEERLLTECLGC